MKARIFTLFYGIGLSLLAAATLPRFFYQYLFYNKYRKSWKQRFGFGGLPDIPNAHLKIWVHAVSVGEAKAVIPLIKKMHREGIHWIFSSLTETGFDEVKRSLEVPVTQVFLPLDFRCIIKPLVEKVRPDLVLISETDLWYNFLSAVNERNIPVALVNGKISERTFTRLKNIYFFGKRLFSLISYFCVQSKTYADRFQQLGVSSSKISITGNLKWDQEIRPLKDPDEFRKEWGINVDEKVIVLGSTHPGEERMLLDQLVPLLQNDPKLKLLVVPRHPERFEAVRELIQNTPSKQIVLIDRMGILTDCYQIAHLVILGGSFVPGIGGHNILEPCQAGVGVLFGPYMHNQEEMVKLVLEASAGLQMNIESVRITVDTLLSYPMALEAMKESGVVLSKNLIGAVSKTIFALKPLTQIFFHEELAKKNIV